MHRISATNTYPLAVEQLSNTQSAITPLSIGNVELTANVKQLFDRCTDVNKPKSDLTVLWIDLEWNNNQEIISIGLYHAESERKFYSLVRQKTAGRTSVHNITVDMLRSAPSMVHVLKELVEYMEQFQTSKVLLAAHWGLGVDFPKLMKAIHMVGIPMNVTLELADTRYMFNNTLGKSISMKLEFLFQLCKPNETYNKHNALGDAQVIHECTKYLVDMSVPTSDEKLYNHLVWCQPSHVKASFYCLIKNDESAVMPDDYMVVLEDIDNDGECSQQK